MTNGGELANRCQAIMHLLCVKGAADDTTKANSYVCPPKVKSDLSVYFWELYNLLLKAHYVVLGKKSLSEDKDLHWLIFLFLN